jgi:[ribosomal protein S5]-alanine N-acetyltransferase
MRAIVLASCTLRPYRQGDQAGLVRNGNDATLWRNLKDRFPHPYTAEAADAWVALNVANPENDNLAIEVGAEVVGSIGIIPGKDVYRRSAEIGYWLGAAHRGRGIATEAVRAMTDHVFATRDVCRLFASVFEHNAASARVLEKADYVLEGRLRKAVTKAKETTDTLLYARILEA